MSYVCQDLAPRGSAGRRSSQMPIQLLEIVRKEPERAPFLDSPAILIRNVPYTVSA